MSNLCFALPRFKRWSFIFWINRAWSYPKRKNKARRWKFEIPPNLECSFPHSQSSYDWELQLMAPLQRTEPASLLLNLTSSAQLSLSPKRCLESWKSSCPREQEVFRWRFCDLAKSCHLLPLSFFPWERFWKMSWNPNINLYFVAYSPSQLCPFVSLVWAQTHQFSILLKEGVRIHSIGDSTTNDREIVKYQGR